MHKFLPFLESLKTEGNSALLDSIMKGFFACFENFDNQPEVVIRVIKTDDGFVPVKYNTILQEIEDELGSYTDVSMAVKEAEAWSHETDIPFIKRLKKTSPQLV